MENSIKLKPELALKKDDIIQRNWFIDDKGLSELLKVNWVVGEEIGASVLNDSHGASMIIDLNNLSLELKEEIILIKAAEPTFQSTVAHLTDDELKRSIEELRNSRLSFIGKGTRKKKADLLDSGSDLEGETIEEDPARSAVKSSSAKSPKLATGAIDPISVMLSKLSPEKRIELQKKLGLVD